MAQTGLSQIVSFCKRRGFIFGGSEIYGGLSSIWDYGPMGVIIKKRIKDLWWDTYVERRRDIVGLDSSIVMHQDVFVASGHLEGFADYLVDCAQCKVRSRIDQIKKVSENIYVCGECGARIDIQKNQPRKFNLMLKTNVSATEDAPQYAYLRPETAQGIFTNFMNVSNTMHMKLPFGIAQIGKAFRNEVTTGSFIFRMKEFEQMEIEYFVMPEEANNWYEYWVDERFRFYKDKIGLSSANLRLRPHREDELAHYANSCTDIEYLFPFAGSDDAQEGVWSELEGIANRGDYDLRQHGQVSRKDLSYFDHTSKKKVIPYVIEPSAGVDRMFFAVICDAYHEEEVRGRTRAVLKLKPHLAPYTAAIFPLLKNNSQLVEFAKKLFSELRKTMPALYDDTGSIGKLYRRQDEIGTPFCVTVDVQTLTDKKITVRDRDTMEQDRIDAERIKEYIDEKLGR